MHYCTIHTPVGELYIAEQDEKIIYIGNKKAFISSEKAEEKVTAVLTEAAKQLAEYFESARREFDLPLAPQGTAFQKKVWEELAKVPYGETVSYGYLAEKVSTKGASQAVGSAMAKNPIAIVLPCHRVLPSSGKLGNYSMGGPANKEWLLLMEQQNVQAI